MAHHSSGMPWVTVGAFLAKLWGAPYAAILLLAALAGYFFGQASVCEIPSTRKTCEFRPSLVAAGLAAWLFPVAVALWSGLPVLGALGVFLSQVSLLTFGGAYAILPAVAREAVEVQQWLPASEMITGLGLAETTPGPLILVLQYVGFAAAWHQPGPLPPWLAGTLGAALASWVTFTPAVVLVLATAPFMERVRAATRWQKALQGISAAVTAMIGFLAVWFGGKVLLANGGVDLWNLVAALVCGLLAVKKYPLERIVMLAAAMGLLRAAMGF
jgi:chromate transporter